MILSLDRHKKIPGAITALGICFFKGVSLDHLHRSDRPGEPAHNSAAYHVKTPENDYREQQALDQELPF